MMKCHRLGCLNSRNVLLTVLEARRSWIDRCLGLLVGATRVRHPSQQRSAEGHVWKMCHRHLSRVPGTVRSCTPCTAGVWLSPVCVCGCVCVFMYFQLPFTQGLAKDSEALRGRIHTPEPELQNRKSVQVGKISET